MQRRTRHQAFSGWLAVRSLPFRSGCHKAGNCALSFSRSTVPFTKISNVLWMLRFTGWAVTYFRVSHNSPCSASAIVSIHQMIPVTLETSNREMSNGFYVSRGITRDHHSLSIGVSPMLSDVSWAIFVMTSGKTEARSASVSITDTTFQSR